MEWFLQGLVYGDDAPKEIPCTLGKSGFIRTPQETLFKPESVLYGDIQYFAVYNVLLPYAVLCNPAAICRQFIRDECSGVTQRGRLPVVDVVVDTRPNQ